MKVHDFRDLAIYQKAFDLQQRIFYLTRNFPKDEQYSLTDQVRQSSRSIGANLAEAWKKRNYPAHFASKLTDADSEQAETIHWIKTALACGYITEKEYEELVDGCEQIGRMLGTMLRDAERWCSGQ